VLEGLASGDGPPRPGLLAEALPACPFGPTAPERAALALFAALPRGSGRADAALARSLAHARAAARRGEGDLPEAPAGGGLAAPAGADPALAGPLLALSDDARRALLAAARAGETMPPPHLAWTPNGGLFLLLDALAALPDPEPGGWPEGPGMEAGPLLRLLVLASAAGPERAEEVFGDPVWRALFGLPPRLLAGDVEAWAAGVPPRAAGAWARRLHGLAGGPPEPAWPGLPGALRRAVGLGAAAVLRGFSRRLPGFAGSSAAYLRANFLGEGARVERTALRAEAVLARPTLDVVLAMSAVSDATLTLGWLRPPTIRIRRGP
jgi:hypothetical protein